MRSKNWRLQNQLKQRQLLLGRRRLGLANAAAGAAGATTAGLLKKRLGAAAAAAVATGQSKIGVLNAVKLGTDDSTNVMTRYSSQLRMQWTDERTYGRAYLLIARMTTNL